MPPPWPHNSPRPAGILVPRWVAYVAAGLVMAFLAHRILRDPTWTVQRLASPDGRRTALLQRTTYVKDHFRVRVKDGRLWFTPYYSPPFTNDFRVDLGERLRWSEDGQHLFLRVRGREIWTYDFTRDEARNLLDPAAFPPPAQAAGVD